MTTSLAAPQGTDDAQRRVPTVMLIGNPNAGKTALFNALTGLRAKTANYPGITVDVRRGNVRLGNDESAELLDLPGLYSLDALTPEEEVAEAALRGEIAGQAAPDAVLLVIDATNLQRNLFLASEVLEMGHPTVIALSLIDAARASEIEVNVEALSQQLRCPVVPVSSRTGEGLGKLRETLASTLAADPLQIISHEAGSCTAGCNSCPFVDRYQWADKIAEQTVRTSASHGRRTDAIDAWLTKPAVGIVAFLLVMLGVFYLIFSFAQVPMALVEQVFGLAGSWADRLLPEQAVGGLMWKGGAMAAALAVFAVAYRVAEVRWRAVTGIAAVAGSAWVATLSPLDFRSLVIDGVIGGVGGVIVFLPQICILFFFISLLEDSGYLARAAFVMERVMRSVGLPGKAFVPMLSAHACAIPGIMAARVIDNWRDRLVTILVLPLMTCSARLPVYAMVAALLFGDSPAQAAAVFVGAYLLGIAAALGSALFLKKSILPGETVPLVLELPSYRLPSLRNALLTVVDRASIFVRKAGTAILLISVVLWALATFPKLPDEKVPAEAAAKIARLEQSAAAAEGQAAEELLVEAGRIRDKESLAFSAAGRIGRAVQPIFAPLGFDWQINVGVISSFAAREVVVSALAVIYGIGEDAAEETDTLTETLQRQQHADGTPVFTTATSLSLLVFYVLAMQCLPTQVVTRRETGSWKWGILQLGYMTLLAYVAALITYQSLSALGYA